VAIATFLVLYRIVALGMVTLVERAKNIEFDKPSIKWGIIFSAILPFVIAAVLLLLILVGITNGSPDRSASKVSSN
jgi:large-conductance mechanosensitive channel